MGASLVKFVRARRLAWPCACSRGERRAPSARAEQREGEMRAAAAEAGRRAGDPRPSRTARIFDTYETRVRLAEVVRKFRPKIVFAPYHTNPSYHKDGAAHPDHTATGTIVRSALRYARFSGLKDAKGEPWNADHLLYYMVPRTRTPTLLNDVSAYMTEWEAIARCHESQMSLRDGKVLDGLRRFREVLRQPAGSGLCGRLCHRGAHRSSTWQASCGHPASRAASPRLSREPYRTAPPSGLRLLRQLESEDPRSPHLRERVSSHEDNEQVVPSSRSPCSGIRQGVTAGRTSCTASSRPFCRAPGRPGAARSRVPPSSKT